MEIYIDVFFMINFIADFLLLILCDMRIEKILKKSFSAFIGSVYACLFVFNLPIMIYSLPIRLIILGAMCYIAFNPQTVKVFFEKYFSFLMLSMVFCGVFFAVPSFLNLSDIPWILLMFSAFFITRISLLKIKNKLYSKNCRIKIQYNKKCVIINGMIDTGNTLRDTNSSMSVLIIDEKIIKELFSTSATKNNLCEFVNPEHFRVIPYKTIANSGVTYGFLPEKLLFEDKEIKNTIVAVAPSPIGSDALISPQII